jgi:hypothetical protein
MPANGQCPVASRSEQRPWWKHNGGSGGGIEALEGRFKQPETSTGSWTERTSTLLGSWSHVHADINHRKMQTRQTRQTRCGSSASNFALSFFASNSLFLCCCCCKALLPTINLPFSLLLPFSTSLLSCLESSGFLVALLSFQRPVIFFFTRFLRLLYLPPSSPGPVYRYWGFASTCTYVLLVHFHKDEQYVESPANRFCHR